jgi:PAS domain S-box-containing protein
METIKKTKKEMLSEIEELNRRLEEANDTIEAIRTGQIDALVVQGSNGHQLYTLKSADQTYRVFIEKMTEGAVTLNQRGIIVYCNSKFASMVRLSLSHVLGLPFAEFIAPENKMAFEVLFEKCWKEDCKGEVLLKGGNEATPVQLSLTTLELDEGISLSIILTDLTAQKQAQQQLSVYNEQLKEINHALEDSNHDLQQFASVASHDLQEPLRKILIFSNLMTERYGAVLPEESQRYLEKIVDSAGRMKNLIIDVLNYSRLSSSFSHFDCIDLNLLMNDVLMDFDLMVQEKGAKIIVGDLSCIDVNKGQIRQVFQNIISNALKFVGPGSSPVINISSRRLRERSADSAEEKDGPFCLISIRDNGIGFDEQYAQNIFALFERLHSKDKYEGTGIGLAIAKKIIEKHNGLIEVRSKEGSGSEFIIVLPVKQQPK